MSADLSPVKQAREYVILANRLLKIEVVKARRDGSTWQALGEALGVTHQGARSRWAPVVQALDAKQVNGQNGDHAVPSETDHAGGIDGHAPAGQGDGGD